MRVALYARFSSDAQQLASIDDQLEVCRRYAARQGWIIARWYTDAAIIGASRFRPAYQQLLADLDRALFDIVLVEALDRLGRKLADVADLHDRCLFHGIKLHAVNVGEIGAMHIGMLGTMAQLYLSDLREKTWRGQLGRALQGKLPGGNAYGYDIVQPGTGERRINPIEAAVVRRIFGEFAAGLSPRAIARRLNQEGVSGPGGRPWGDTTLRGQAERGTGILNNALYVGRLEWNRCGYIKDPRTGRRVARPNPRDRWEVVQLPQLRIVEDQVWQRVKDRQRQLRFAISRDADDNALNRAHRRRFLLSGLIVCGACGGGYTIIGPNRYGCAAHRSKGTCNNKLTIDRGKLEARVLAGLKEQMMAPELVEAFIEEFNAEMRRLATGAAAELAAARRAIAETERKIAALIKAIEDGAYTPALKERLSVLERQKAEAVDRLAATKPEPVLRLHPNLTDLYKTKLNGLAAVLREPEAVAEAGEILRGLIDRIVLTPRGGALKAELHGDLARLMAFAEGKEHKKNDPGPGGSGSLLSVVAGTGFEPVTFRL